MNNSPLQQPVIEECRSGRLPFPCPIAALLLCAAGLFPDLRALDRDPTESQAPAIQVSGSMDREQRRTEPATSVFAQAEVVSTSVSPTFKTGSTHTNTIGLVLIYIPAGSFEMGSPMEDADLFTSSTRSRDEDLHFVDLPQPFLLGRTEVTQGQWRAVMGNSPSKFTGSDDLPVEQVSWNDAMAFCAKLTAIEHSSGALPAGWLYTLPTEEQWEYACRAGMPASYSGELDPLAWYAENSGMKTQPVATKAPNAWGLYDMLGNVWEWTRTHHLDLEKYATSQNIPFRVDRGGAYGSGAQFCRPAYRSGRDQSARDPGIGFRLAAVPSP